MSGGDTAPASMEPADADEITVLDEQDGKWSTSVIKSKEELEPSLNQARAATADQPVRKFNAAGVMHASAPRNARATAPNHNSPDLPESLPNFVHDSKLMKTQSASQSSELGDEQEPPEDHVLTTEKAGREHGQNTDFKTGSPDAELGGENTRLLDGNMRSDSKASVNAETSLFDRLKARKMTENLYEAPFIAERKTSNKIQNYRSSVMALSNNHVLLSQSIVELDLAISGKDQSEKRKDGTTNNRPSLYGPSARVSLQDMEDLRSSNLFDHTDDIDVSPQGSGSFGKQERKLALGLIALGGTIRSRDLRMHPGVLNSEAGASLPGKPEAGNLSRRETESLIKSGCRFMNSEMDLTGEKDSPYATSMSDGKNRARLAKAPSHLTSVFDFKEDESPEWRQRVLKYSESWPFLLFIVVLSLWALFSDDLRLAACPPASDPFFLYSTYFMIVVFTAELVVSSVVKPKYLFSFYFWLDFVATASLVFDIPAVNEAILNASNEETSDSGALARAGRTSRVGTRAGRILRVIRIVRLVRMLKIYKALSLQLAKMSRQNSRAQTQGDDMLDEDGNPLTSESRVGVKLTELTTRRIIFGVLIMLIVVPAFQVDNGFYGGPDPFPREGLYMLHNTYAISGDSSEYQAALMTYKKAVGYALVGKGTGGIIELYIGNYTVYNDTEVIRRTYETISYTCNCEDDPIINDYCELNSSVIVDHKWSIQFESILSIGRTLFTCIILGVGALLFSRDANTLVLHPLERMVQKVKEMSENPLAKMQIRAVATKDEQQMETRILENSITKICSLLAVGFGDAGAEVVAENIRNGGDLNPMVPGHRMMAIFGFCDIRRFTDATEVLQEEVMEFVNSIAKIVHMEVSLHGGSANKNIGDAFLLVWKLPSQLLTSADDLAVAAANLPKDKRDSIAYLADRALAAFVVIHVALKRSPRLKQFCMRSDIRRRMGDNFQVSMGFGLHIGWAIEGAIGSEYKIDASYLSPNVNMASRLEAATKQFGTSILMSDDFALMLSPRVRKLCRPIDCITVKGSNKPVTLYTYDISLSGIQEPDENKFQDDNMENLSHSFLSFKNEFEENPDITDSVGSSQDYRDKFQLGFQAYLDGRWAEARDHLLVCLNRNDPHGMSFTDGPTASLLEVMGRSDFFAPPDWDGVRHLTDK